MRTLTHHALLLLGAATAGTAQAEAPADTSTIVVSGSRYAKDAIAEKRAALNLVDIQSAETIIKYPDFNAAESLARIPGVSLSTDTGEGRFVNIRGIDGNLNGTTFGGVVLLNTFPGGTYFGGGGRAVELDTIPIGAVDSLAVRKTGMPDQEAEGLGGSVELTPRSAAHITKPFVEGTIGGGYQPAHDHWDIIRGDLAAGTRFGPDQKFGIVVYGSYHEDHRGFDDLEESYLDDPEAAPDKAFDNLQLRGYEYNRKRFGFGGELNYDPNPQSHYYIRATDAGYTENARKHQLRYSGLGDDVVVDPANPNGFIASGASTSIRSTDSKESHLNFVAAAGGHNDLEGITVDYQVAYTSSTYHQLYNYGSQFSGPKGLTIGYDNNSNPDVPLLSLPAGFAPDDTSQFKLKSLSNSTQRSFDREFSGRIDLTVPVHLFGDSDSIKFGGKIRQRDKNDTPLAYSYSAPKLLLSTVQGSNRYTSFYGGAYNAGIAVDSAALESYFRANPDQFSQDVAGNAADNASGYFNDTENVYAGYAQYTGKFGGLGVLAGLRVEHTQGTYRGITLTDDGETVAFTPTSRKSNYTNFFPTVQLKYDFTSNLVARATYSTGIGRPGFLQLLAGAQVNIADQTVSVGNPDLQPTTVNAFDAVLEYYLPNNGIIALGAFDKEFNNYVLARTQRNVDYPGIGPGTTVGSFDNVGHSWARGVEAQYTQKFAALPAPFNGLGLTGNVTYVDSRIEIRPGEFSLLPGTANWTWNAGIFYETERLQARLAYQHVGTKIFGIGDSAALDVYEDKRNTLDLTTSFSITPRVQVYFNVRNLTNAPLRFYEGAGARNRPVQREFYDPSYEAGLRIKFL